jgi:hypothetical protein
MLSVVTLCQDVSSSSVNARPLAALYALRRRGGHGILQAHLGKPSLTETLGRGIAARFGRNAALLGEEELGLVVTLSWL